MKLNLRLDSLSLAYVFVTVLLIGPITSAIFTKDLRWINWHFSRLGEGGALSSVIFNIAIFISAIVMFTLDHSLNKDISRIPDTNNVDLVRARIVIHRAFIAITICLVGVSFFPFDRFSVVHDIFGYSMLFIFLALCLFIQKILPIFSKHFYTYSRLVIICTVICYILFFGFRAITLLTVEFIIFSFLYGWLLMFIKGIAKQSYSHK